MHRLVRDLKLEARGGHRRKDRDNQEGRSDSGGNCYGARSNQFGSRQRRDRSHSWESCQCRDCSHSLESRQRQDCSCSREYANRGLDSPEEQQPRNVAMDEMSRTLCRAARSPFSDDIERASMPSRFTSSPFNSYDGKTDPVEHLNHYI